MSHRSLCLLVLAPPVACAPAELPRRPAPETPRAAAARLARIVRAPGGALRHEAARLVAGVAVRRAATDPLAPRGATDALARALADAAGARWRDPVIRRRCRALAHVAVLAATRLAARPDALPDPDLYALSVAAAVCARTAAPPRADELDAPRGAR